MKKQAEIEPQIASGTFTATLCNPAENFIATHIYRTLSGNALLLRGTQVFDDKNNVSIDIEFRDRIPGNNLPDLPPAGRYLYPHPDIKIKYYGIKNSTFFEAEVGDGSVTVSSQIAWQNSGKFLIELSLDEKPLIMFCKYDVTQ
jgi:hypothetical protein